MSVKTVIFDIDGTICPIKKKEESYKDLVPYKDMVLPLFRMIK
jgi:FMN phosphatase YigB (HAD superfamily)